MRYSRGFTLMEVLVYLALFALVFGGAITAAYSIFESSGRTLTKIMIQEEGDFLIAKINWALSGAQSVTSPAIGSSGQMLSIAKYDTSVGNPIVIDLSGTNMILSRGANPSHILNNSNIQVSALVFTHVNASGDGTNPESVRASFTVNARTPNGMAISQNFSSINYLRK